MTIKRIEIGKFRNLQNVSFDLNGSYAFCGNNRIGKTNTLNAIMWCLTGYDLTNSAELNSFIPFDERENSLEGNTLIDVKVVFDSFDVRKQVIKGTKAPETKIYIDGVICETIKSADIRVDTLLGILPLTIYAPKGFNVRRFVFDPLYINYVAPKSIREFVLSFLKDKVDIAELLSTQPDMVVSKIRDSLLSHKYSISDTSTEISKAVKDSKDSKALTDSVIKVVKTCSCDTTEVIKELQEKLKTQIDTYNSNVEKSVALDSFVEIVNKEYDKVSSSLFKGITIKLLEKGVGEDVWKDVCYPLIKQNGFSIFQGSTSEKIIAGCNFVDSFLKGIGADIVLPFIFDEAETLDNKSITELQLTTTRQVLTARVESSEDNALKAERIY